MNIESKRYQVRSMFAGGIELHEKQTGRCVVVEPSDIPSASALATMHERTFDKTIRDLMA